jgi:hypothetical protein
MDFPLLIRRNLFKRIHDGANRNHSKDLNLSFKKLKRVEFDRNSDFLL